jgi:hypothetical protein
MENIKSIPDNNDSTEVIKKLEQRLEYLERQLNYQTEVPGVSGSAALSDRNEDELEFRIGQYWLPKLGIFVFIVGVIFFLTLPFEGLGAAVPSFIGYATALAILAISHFSRKNFAELTPYFIGGSAMIAYLATLRLFFFGSETVIDSWVLEFLGLFFVVSTTLWYALKNDSVYLASMGIFLAYFTALTIGEPYVLLTALLISTAAAVKIYLHKNWEGFLVFSIIIAFLAHATWFMTNPFFTPGIETMKGSDINLLFILGYIALFSGGILYRKDNASEEFMNILASLLNSAFGYGLFLIITLINPTSNFGIMHLLAASVFLAVAVMFWVKEKSQYSTFIYAMTGYASLSVAIIFEFNQPLNLILLCWQSILVLSTAVWFKSRFIIVANFMIFLMVLAAYLFTYWTLQTEAISFGLTALISARILNWQKNNLELKTEVLRNSYLITALFWIPYLFYCVLPSIYVGFSLLALALAYFGMGKLIRNLKYRWMAVMTLLITVFYLMIFGITNPDISYKITSFLLAGIILIITSAAYNKISQTNKGKIKTP